MMDYDWAIIERNFEKHDVYDETYECTKDIESFKSFKYVIEILIKKDMIIKMYKNNVSITDISKYVDLDDEVVQKIIDNSKKEFDFKVLKRIIEECNLVE